jgi:hypothetical protein
MDTTVLERPKAQKKKPLVRCEQIWQEWQELFAYGERFAAENNLKEEDVMTEIKLHRSGK